MGNFELGWTQPLRQVVPLNSNSAQSLPSSPHLNPEQEGTESDPHVSAWTPQGMPEASPQVPDSRWSRVMEFHLLVMSM